MASDINIITHIITILAPTAAMFIGYLIAVKKFKKEHIWQEKYKSYQDILSALEAMMFWANATYATAKMIPGPSTHKDKDLSFSEARRIIAKATCVGSLLISDKVIIELEKLETSLWNEDFRAEEDCHYHPDTQEELDAFGDHAENVRKLLVPSLEKVLKLSKEDLLN